MRVALAQMTSVPDLHLNIKFIEDNIIEAKNNGADLILFPEKLLILSNTSNIPTLSIICEGNKSCVFSLTRSLAKL